MQRRQIKIKRGLTLPIAGAPVSDAGAKDGGDPRPIRSVALLGPDYRGLKPTLKVTQGDRVRLGQTLFEDKSNPGVKFTAPAAGTVSAVNRGARRALISVVIQLESDDEIQFPRYEVDQLPLLDRDAVRTSLLDSGLWTALRKRPYGKIPSPEAEPAALFITAMDSNPLAVDPGDLVQRHGADLNAGILALSRLLGGPVYFCCAPTAATDEVVDLPDDRLRLVEFSGPHPSGLPGTHIHFLNPVAAEGPEAWYLDLQDAIAIGKLFLTGRLWTRRYVTLAGPRAANPRRVETRLGANITDLCRDEVKPGPQRLISGSVFNGHQARDYMDYLGRYARQVTALEEGERRRFFGWLAPGSDRYSAINAFVSRLGRRRDFPLTTSQNGSPRAMVPIGNFEKVLPLDMLPAPLLKSLIVRDTDSAQALGCMELDDEDLALCSFVCPSKYDYGGFLVEALAQIEKEG
ncbi:MAG: Na(+)-translocating NADH-quinone reductase subunit A [Xanthomonadales bacterium]|nr:Na(+)-translocating NADH-quinone reductase subunit A [Xanthomonadales bacterium]